jgi:phage regulator Rha-like protein
MTALDREVAQQTPAHNHLRSARSDRFDKMKERLDTEAQMYDLPPEDRADHEAHIEKLQAAENDERTASEKEDLHKMQNGMLYYSRRQR